MEPVDVSSHNALNADSGTDLGGNACREARSGGQEARGMGDGGIILQVIFEMLQDHQIAITQLQSQNKTLSIAEPKNTPRLELAKSLGAEVIEAKCDSILVVNQVNKSFEVRKDRMQRYLDKIQVTLHRFKKRTLDHVPQEQNSEVDALANLGSSVEEDDIVPGIVVQLSRYVVEEGHAEINSMSLMWDWRNIYIDYLKSGKLPSDNKESRALRAKAARFALDEDRTLY
uniref:Uncharacterized protein LOC104229724 n=1 Tax=Nicotiana sylvestris TaxID=4096 RepID=A0A1U7WL70_NICSY|nr:PREDICTED: uncharacterized protein LOC104229724 [Nicotiana sylvestris]